MSKLLNCDAAKFAAVACFASTEETRYYLNGVNCTMTEAGDLLLVATNGHVLGVAIDREGECSQPEGYADDFILKLSAAGLKACKPVKNDAGRQLVITQTPEDITATIYRRDLDGDLQRVFVDIDAEFTGGKYPDWRRIIPNHDFVNGGPVPFFNAEYIALFVKAGQLLTSNRQIFLAVIAENKADPAHVIIAGIDARDFHGIVMPVRQDDDRAKVPAWLNQQLGPMAAATTKERLENKKAA